MTWDFRSDRPIYSQIVEHITLFVASGEMKAGERVPPVRELAASAGVNPNTMQRALAELERVGLMVTNRTTGRFVTDDSECIEKTRRTMARDYASDFLRRMKLLGYSNEEAAAIINDYKGESDYE